VLGFKLKIVLDISGGMVNSATERCLFANQIVIRGTRLDSTAVLNLQGEWTERGTHRG
jgi:hypothetical protein